MGCDIHSYAERKQDDGSWTMIRNFSPFNDRIYGVFAFLADVRNYAAIEPIVERQGLPEDISGIVSRLYESWSSDAHSTSWLSVEELTSFDYDALTEDRRCMRNNDGGSTCEPGEVKVMTYREFLGPQFFKDLEMLKVLSAGRVVFWFDN